MAYYILPGHLRATKNELPLESLTEVFHNGIHRKPHRKECFLTAAKKVSNLQREKNPLYFGGFFFQFTTQ